MKGFKLSKHNKIDFNKLVVNKTFKMYCQNYQFKSKIKYQGKWEKQVRTLFAKQPILVFKSFGNILKENKQKTFNYLEIKSKS